MGGFCFLLLCLCLGMLGLDSKSQALDTVITTSSVAGLTAPTPSSASSTAAGGEAYIVPPQLLEDFSHAYVEGVPLPWKAGARDTLNRGLGRAQVSFGGLLDPVKSMILMAVLEAISPRLQAVIGRLHGKNTA